MCAESRQNISKSCDCRDIFENHVRESYLGSHIEESYWRVVLRDDVGKSYFRITVEEPYQRTSLKNHIHHEADHKWFLVIASKRCRRPFTAKVLENVL